MKINLKILDVRNKNLLNNFVQKVKPSIIFHLAAQPLIYESYEKPHLTFDINFNGSLNITDISFKSKFVKSLVVVTSDKCYESNNSKIGYMENDILGGIDPYSSSKAVTEIMVRAYRKSFLNRSNRPGISTGRAGNVIGGGDWSNKRLIPDCIRSICSNKTIVLRNPNFNRPWQHVLEPLKGYLILAKKQYFKPLDFSGAWNFGTNPKSLTTVKKIVEFINYYFPKSIFISVDPVRDNNKIINKIMIELDRGKFIRTKKDFSRLIKQFKSIITDNFYTMSFKYIFYYRNLHLPKIYKEWQKLKYL